ncbi:MAG: glycosyltransferase family 39 protein [Chloracidobacterium sp.]|nr:glycosyltransferase family 39 protein [Chloracidobacterium sp.]
MPDRTARAGTGSFPLILLHLLIVIPLAFSLNIWAEEAATLYSTQHGLLSAIRHAAIDERQAPLYFWIMSLWRSIDASIFFARLFSIICSVAAIRVFAGTARRMFSREATLLATAFFAIHPVLVWASTEIRSYSLLVLLSVISVRFFLDIFLESDGRRNARWLWLAFTAIVAAYTSCYLLLLFAGFLAAFLVAGRWEQARRYLLIAAVAAIACVPLIFIVKPQPGGDARSALRLIDGLRILWDGLLTFILPTELFSSSAVTAASTTRTWIVLTGLGTIILAVIRRRDSISRLTAALGPVTGVSAAMLLGACFASGPFREPRGVVVVLFVPVLFFAASLLTDLFNRTNERTARLASLAAGFVVLASFSYALLNLYPAGVKRGDWARIGAFIQENERPGQPIVVFPAFDAMALPYHYRGLNHILPVGNLFEFSTGTSSDPVLSRAREADSVITQIPGDTEEIWLVTGEICRTTRDCAPLDNFVAANYTIVIEKDFYLEKLFLLRRKTP